MRQIPLAIGFDPAHSFENFVPGANQPALEHLRCVTRQSAPVYLWGPAGSGKTHLLQALANAWQAAGERVGWFTPAELPPWPHGDERSLIVLDDCDGFNAEQQHAAFALFVDAAMGGVAVASAGCVPPVDLPLRADLRSRLGWGVVFALQPLSESDARAVLRREADQRGIFLSDDVMDYLLTRFARDLKHLMTLLTRLDEFALSTQRAVTVPLVKQMLSERT
ncbi:MAG: DnaA regulatory inactivator Hda [Burkholderiaceae bacterium]|nr:DnaA regulatory inactivator Hda [Burkholderiaceae bacterium]